MHLRRLLFFVTFLRVDASTGEQIDLFILAGQSNAQGWMGDAAYYPADNGAPSDCGASVLAVVRDGS